ncbi:MAG TPA: FAD-dependent oxidoreductase [Burkholderiales bacterium]|nr:FAD-dependent oxidoreductase [Burkholderiales bacterium]
MARVAIIGAGVMGLATARALARAGHEVVVYEQFERGHARGSSHGRSRIFRLAYSEPRWVRLAQEALAGWRELEAESGERLLELTGLIEIVSDLSESSAAALDACHIAWERLGREDVERRFPLRISAGSFGVLQPEAGIVRADRALAAFARGVDVRYGTRVRSLAELDAACVVVTAGAWVNDLVQPPLPVRVTRETVCYFRLADPRPVPAFVFFGPHSGGICLYALRDPVYGIKAAAHHAGPEVDPDDTGKPDAALVDKVAAWVAEHVPLADSQPVETQTCLYTTTDDESFILERRGRVVVGSACSGHGFKFAPAIGARLASLALELL